MGAGLSESGRLGRVLNLIRWWTDAEPPAFDRVGEAAAKLRELLAGRRTLLVVDDAWSYAEVEPFLAAGTATLVTTRLADVLPQDSERLDVDALRPGEARALLRYGIAETGREDALDGLARRLGEWPLLLKLVNAKLRRTPPPPRDVARGRPALGRAAPRHRRPDGVRAPRRGAARAGRAAHGGHRAREPG